MQLKWQISFLIYSFKWLSGKVSLPVHTAVSWVGVERLHHPHALMIRATVHLLRKRWKHLLHKLAIWRLKNSIPRSWFKHLGKACLEPKESETFCPLMLLTFRGHYRLFFVLFFWPCALWTAQLVRSISHFLPCFRHLLLICSYTIYRLVPLAQREIEASDWWDAICRCSGDCVYEEKKCGIAFNECVDM